ncbi:MAG: hypothetical protein Q7U04_06015 [Bacteriovorax sp.]|nr:hypothetical protein [Bacteriovorax sp.]
MIGSSMLKDLLLVTNPQVLGLSNYLNQSALLFLLPAFYIGMIVEYFTNFDFKSVAKRSVIAFLAIKLLVPIHIEAVDTSLKVSSELLGRYSPQNKFLMAYQNAKGEIIDGVKPGIWSRLTNIVKMVVTDPIVMIIFLLSYVAFFLLTQLYSLTYHLTIALFGLCAVLSILPITSKSLTGAVKTSLWCIIMPFVVAIVLALIGDSDAFFKTYSGGIVQNLESLIQLLVMTIILLLTPMITSKIMNDSGVSGVAENLGQMAAMSTMIGGASIASKFIGSKSQMIGGAVHSSTTKPLMNKIKGSVSNRASEISQTKGIGPTLNTLTSSSGTDKLKSGLTDFKDGMKKTSFSEKVVLGADAVMNRKENSLAKMGRVQEAQNLKQYQDKKMSDVKSYTAQATPFANRSVLPLGDYKKEAREYLAQRNIQRNTQAKMKRQIPEARSFLKNRTPHVLNPIPQHHDKNGELVLERKKMKPREKVVSKRPFMQRPNLKPSLGV